MIIRELCKKLKFDHMNKWYIHNPEFVLNNEMLKILWDFEIKTDHLISARRPNLGIIKKKKKRKKKEKKREFAVWWTLLSWLTLEKNWKKDKYLELASELKKTWNMKVTRTLIIIGDFNTITK